VDHLVIRCVRQTSESDDRQRIDRRLMTLESMSAECSALLAKVSIKQYHGNGYCGQVAAIRQNRTLISI